MSDAFLIAHIGHTTKSREHVLWWMPDSRGYTICIDRAGRYDEEAARRICQSQWGGSIAVRARAVESLALSTPYYRRLGGLLAKLYDGGPHRPVANGWSAWRHLLNNRLLCSETVQKPTPIPPAKSRAIYLDGVAA